MEKKHEFDATMGRNKAVALSVNGEVLATTSAQGRVRCYNLAEGRQSVAFEHRHDSAVKACDLLLLPSTRMWVSWGTDDGTVGAVMLKRNPRLSSGGYRPASGTMRHLKHPLEVR